jgi:hypothetical protein
MNMEKQNMLHALEDVFDQPTDAEKHGDVVHWSLAEARYVSVSFLRSF